MVNVYDCHSASSSSFWKRLFGKSTFYQKIKQQRTVKQLFDVTKKLVRDQKEIQGISVIDWLQFPWKRATLLTDRAVQRSKAKTNVFSDSILCMGRISENPASAWKEKIDWFLNSSQCRELGRMDGEGDGARVEKSPRNHKIADSRRSPEHDD